MKDKFKNLLTIKSIVTLLLTFAFVFLIVYYREIPQDFLSIFTMVIGFYFGTQKIKED